MTKLKAVPYHRAYRLSCSGENMPATSRRIFFTLWFSARLETGEIVEKHMEGTRGTGAAHGR